MARKRVAVLISGRGSNMQALIEAARSADYPAEIALVLSNRADAAGLGLARREGLATAVVPHRDYASREAFDAALDGAIRAARADLVCLAGFMRLLTPGFVAAWRDRAINVHPSLLPAFPGLRTHDRAIAAGVRFSGCTVHFVRAEMDTGPILVQAVVPVLPADSAEALAARVLEAEHRCYPWALRLVAAGRVRVEAERALIDGARVPTATAIAPEPD